MLMLHLFITAFFSPLILFITQEKLESAKRKQHHDGGCRHQCRTDLIFKVLKLKAGRVESWLVYVLDNFRLLPCPATPGKPLKLEWLEGTGSRQSRLPRPRYNVQKELGDTFGWFMLDPHKLWVTTLLHWSVCSLGHRKDPPVTGGMCFLPRMAKLPVTGNEIVSNRL